MYPFLNADYTLEPFEFQAFRVTLPNKEIVQFEGEPTEAWKKFLQWRLDNKVEGPFLYSSDMDHLVMDAPNLEWGEGSLEHNGNTYNAEMLITSEVT